MMKVNVVNRQGDAVGTVDVDPAEFGGEINKQLLHDVVLQYLANQRAGTHSTLRRGEVAGSTRKLFRQKGTGNARVGTRRTNKRRGGGTAKGPKPRDYAYYMPKKMVRAALRMAILSKFQDNEAARHRRPRGHRNQDEGDRRAPQGAQAERRHAAHRHQQLRRREEADARRKAVQVGPEHRGRRSAAGGAVQRLHGAEAEAPAADEGGTGRVAASGSGMSEPEGEATDFVSVAASGSD